MSTTNARSIKQATTSAEVFQALVAQITTVGAIIPVNSYGKDCTISQKSPEGFTVDTKNGLKTVFPCRTNKYAPTIAAAVKEFQEIVLDLTVEEAREEAYSIIDKNSIKYDLWEDNAEFNQLAARRAFLGKCVEETYADNQGEQQTRYKFVDVSVQEIKAENTSLSPSMFSLPHAGAELPATTAPVATAPAKPLTAAQKVAAAKAKAKAVNAEM